MNHDALLAHLVGHEARHVGVEAAQQLGAAHQLRHLGAQAVKDGRHFAGDVAAAHHHQVFREQRQIEHLVRADRQLAARHLGPQRVAAGGHQHVARLEALAVHLDVVCAGQPCTAAQNRHARIEQQAFVDAVQARYFSAAVGLQQRPVELRLSHLPAVAARFFKGLGVVRRVAVELLRNATQVHAGAAQRSHLGDRHAHTALGRHASRTNAAAAGADHEKVKRSRSHADSSKGRQLAAQCEACPRRCACRRVVSLKMAAEKA